MTGDEIRDLLDAEAVDILGQPYVEAVQAAMVPGLWQVVGNAFARADMLDAAGLGRASSGGSTPAVPDSAWTALPIFSTSFAIGDGLEADAATDAFLVVRAGYFLFLVGASMTIGAPTSGQGYLSLHVNGTAANVCAMWGTSLSSVWVTGLAALSLAAGDVVDLRVMQVTGAPQNVSYMYPRIVAVRLGA